MTCVNRNSDDFKNLADMYGVSINTLELITHKYWNITGKEGDFPPTLFISSQLGQTQYIESSENVREIYKQRYSQPLFYKTQNEMEEAKEQALNFFPQKAVMSYQNNKGEFVLNIKEPVSEIKGIPVKEAVLSDK